MLTDPPASSALLSLPDDATTAPSEARPALTGLVTRAELARLAGVSKAAVTQACRTRLAPACVDGRVDLEHPAAVAWLSVAARPAGKASEPRREERVRRAARAVDELAAADLDALADVLLRVLERALNGANGARARSALRHVLR